MRLENEQALKTEFPIFFVHLTENKIKPEDFEIECGDGWFDLVKRAAFRIEDLNKKNQLNIECYQVKEKWGCLRFNLSIVPPDFRFLVSMILWEAEKTSSQTCEFCGKPGVTRGTYWLITLCDDCATHRKSL